MLIANSDGEFHRKEEMFFEQTATMLGYRLSGDYIDDLLAMGKEKLFQLLKSLDESQKDWSLLLHLACYMRTDKHWKSNFSTCLHFLSQWEFPNNDLKMCLLRQSY